MITILKTSGCLLQPIITRTFVVIMNNRTIKENIYKLRRDKGLSQEEVANLMDISLTSYRKIEKGETALVSERINQLANVLGTSEQELLLGKSIKYNQLLQKIQQLQEVIKYILLQKIDLTRLQVVLEQKDRQIALLEKAVSDKEEIIRLLHQKN